MATPSENWFRPGQKNHLSKWSPLLCTCLHLTVQIAFQTMATDKIQKLQQALRDVPDFPKPGIIFKDITTILADGDLFRTAIDIFLEANAGARY